jgi:hypothetical protein
MKNPPFHPWRKPEEEEIYYYKNVEKYSVLTPEVKPPAVSLFLRPTLLKILFGSGMDGKSDGQLPIL